MAYITFFILITYFQCLVLWQTLSSKSCVFLSFYLIKKNTCLSTVFAFSKDRALKFGNCLSNNLLHCTRVFQQIHLSQIFLIKKHNFKSHMRMVWASTIAISTIQFALRCILQRCLLFLWLEQTSNKRCLGEYSHWVNVLSKFSHICVH
jgi:hypothetical protein